MKLKDRYIGIKKATPQSKASNLGFIFIRDDKGRYTCSNCGKGLFSISESQVRNDLHYGYLKEYEK